MAFGLITSQQIDGENVEILQILFSWDPRKCAPRKYRWLSAAMKLKDICSLEEKL